ncbi:MAG TPA: HAD family hydrolase [Methylomirabilota bacterium]|jgi:phosphoglycolate phosphatase-like HAD superfamily hydrolase|nr:HAD family hydrolase [Methylomirabilota bacterium]
MSDAPRVLALDFDGVLCDGRPEYFETARRAYRSVWPAAADNADADLAERFAAARPLVESGWEMPVLLHALLTGVSERELIDRHAWLPVARRLVAEAGLDAETLARALNAARDAWFARDPEGWVRHHTFYPGVPARVLEAIAAGVDVAVVTTKAERFARALLRAQDAQLAALPIVGRDPERSVPKSETLSRLAQDHALSAGEGLWFVEDLLETLVVVHATPRLDGVGLFLASWGYNTLEHRAAAAAGGAIRVLSLAQFRGPFGSWRR